MSAELLKGMSGTAWSMSLPIVSSAQLAVLTAPLRTTELPKLTRRQVTCAPGVVKAFISLPSTKTTPTRRGAELVVVSELLVGEAHRLFT